MELLLDRSWKGILSRCILSLQSAVVGAPIRSRLVVELDTHRHIWQLPSRRALPWCPLAAPRNENVHNARTAQYSRVQQHRATGQRVATRAHKRIQYSYSGCSISFVHMGSSSFLISANPKYNIANEVALNQGGSNGISLQYSHHHQQYEALLCGEQADTLHTQARESPTNEQQAHIHRSLPRSLNRISESQTHKRRPSSLWL